MSVYWDASVLVSFFVTDAHTAKAHKKLGDVAEPGVVSDFAGAEFVSALGKRVRMRDLTVAEARQAIATFDTWRLGYSQTVAVAPEDIAQCDVLLRRLDLPLRTPDALNIAVARRLGLSLVTFDTTMALCARKLGLKVERL